MPAPRKYPLELGERAVWMYRTAEPKSVIRRVAGELGVHHEALREWIRQAEADAGERDDLLTPPSVRSLPPGARRLPSSSVRTRSCGRPRYSSPPSSPRPRPGDGAHQRADPHLGVEPVLRELNNPLLHPLLVAPGRERTVRTVPPGR
ncbi:transposase [Streptomyces chryseus]